MYKLKNFALAGLVAVAGNIASADSRVLNNDASPIAFGSAKKDAVGEVHSFERIDMAEVAGHSRGASTVIGTSGAVTLAGAQL